MVPAQMLLEGSVSPDGRIDSLSIEFNCPVADVAAAEIKARAHEALRLQTELIEGFLRRTPPAEATAAPPPAQTGNGGNGGARVPAELVCVGGRDTLYGRRLYIAAQANGSALKLFGGMRQLGAALADAGYPHLADRLAEGADLRLRAGSPRSAATTGGT